MVIQWNTIHTHYYQSTVQQFDSKYQVWVVYHINPIATLFKGKKVHLEQITQRLVASLLI